MPLSSVDRMSGLAPIRKRRRPETNGAETLVHHRVSGLELTPHSARCVRAGALQTVSSTSQAPPQLQEETPYSGLIP